MPTMLAGSFSSTGAGVGTFCGSAHTCAHPTTRQSFGQDGIQSTGGYDVILARCVGCKSPVANALAAQKYRTGTVRESAPLTFSTNRKAGAGLRDRKKPDRLRGNTGG